MNFNPEMFNNFKHLINPHMMRQVGDNIKGMSDEELEAMLKAIGKFIFF